MKRLIEYIPIIIVGAIVTFIVLTPSLPYSETKKHCVIDSIVVEPKYSFMPEMVHRYHTKCGYWFTSNKGYEKGDTVEYQEIRYYREH